MSSFDAFDFERHDLFTSVSDIIHAPHPDLFESELDSSLAALNNEFNLEVFQFDSIDAYSFLRSDTPTCGPPSIVTVSSESAYDSISSHSNPYSPSNYSMPLGLEMDFRKFSVDVPSGYSAAVNPAQTNVAVPDTIDPTSFGTLPPTPPHSPPVPSPIKSFDTRAFSDYGPPTNTRLGSTNATPDFYRPLSYNADTITLSTVSPTRVSSQIPITNGVSRAISDDGFKGDPRKKYKCNVCPRAFARAYNLKTHQTTHDPNRLKPHVCPHTSCLRSFSRKHDLGRHLVSIHREDSISTHHSASTKRSIGVAKGPRGWCDSCGEGWVGKDKGCTCQIK